MRVRGEIGDLNEGEKSEEEEEEEEAGWVTPRTAEDDDGGGAFTATATPPARAPGKEVKVYAGARGCCERRAELVGGKVRITAGWPSTRVGLTIMEGADAVAAEPVGRGVVVTADGEARDTRVAPVGERRDDEDADAV
jgi:hypothetical protein